MANEPINFVDPLGLLTFGIDYSITGGDGSAATGGTTYVIDSQGNYGIVEYAGAGGYLTTHHFSLKRGHVDIEKRMG